MWPTAAERAWCPVRVDASQFEGWFYEGAGIYRHVWLVKTSPLAVVPDGVFVYSSFKNNVPEGAPDIHATVRLRNAQDLAAEATVKCQIIGPEGNPVASMQQTQSLAPWFGRRIQTHYRD